MTRSEASVSSSSTQDSSEQDELSQDERTREEFRLYREMAEKYRRDLKVRYRLKLFSVAFFLTCAFGLLTLAIGPLFPYRAFIASVSIVSFLASSGLTVFLYLQKTSTLSEPAISLESNSQIQRVTPATIQGYGAEIVDDFGNVVPRPPRKYRRALAPRTGESLEATSLKDKVVVRQFEQSRARLAQEIASLQRRGNLNLVLGILISFLGLSVLGYYLLIDKAQTNGVPPPAEDPIAFLIHYIPRLTFVLLIELFAYFFLKLYKNSLSEIKYFQNELTNIEAKHIALRAAFLADSETLSDKAISSLVDTERNHVLEKGQTTVDLERARIDREQWTDIAKTFSSILDFVKKGGKTK